jgi:hypothetical protein
MTMTGLETIGLTAAAKGLTDLVVKPIGEVLNKRLDEPFKQLIFSMLLANTSRITTSDMAF